MILEKEANITFEKLMTEYGDKKGFLYCPDKRDKYNPPYLLRKRSSGFDKISNLHLEFFNKKFSLVGSFEKRIDTIEERWAKYYTTIHPSGNQLNLKEIETIRSNVRLVSDYKFDATNKLQYHRIRDRYEAEASEEGVKEIVDNVISNIEKYVLPVFEKYESLATLNKTINDPPQMFFECAHLFIGSDLIFKKMIVAKLCDDDQYNSVCNAMQERILEIKDDLKMRETYLSAWTNLKADLDQRL